MKVGVLATSIGLRVAGEGELAMLNRMFVAREMRRELEERVKSSRMARTWNPPTVLIAGWNGCGFQSRKLRIIPI